jgi:hypothetical protein
VAGLAITVLGVLLLLDVNGVVDLGWGYLWPAVLAAAGVALFTSGLRRGRTAEPG